MSKSFNPVQIIAGHEIDGNLCLAVALSRIKGIGLSFANMICKLAGIDQGMRVGYLTQDQISKIEEILKDPLKYGIPQWALNRQKDLLSGKDLHLIGSDLDLQVKSDIELMKAMKSWKGVRHALGLKVRGQRTRTTGRTGMAVGVRKSKVGAQ